MMDCQPREQRFFLINWGYDLLFSQSYTVGLVLIWCGRNVKVVDVRVLMYLCNL